MVINVTDDVCQSIWVMMALRSMLGGVLPASQLGWIFSQAGQIKVRYNIERLLWLVAGSGGNWE